MTKLKSRINPFSSELQKILNQDTITTLSSDETNPLIENGVLKTNLLSDDGINIQIDEIRARDTDGLSLNNSTGSGIFINASGQIGIGRIPELTLDVAGGILSRQTSSFEGGEFEIEDADGLDRWIIDQFDDQAGNARFRIFHNSNELLGFAIKENGNMGLGIATPEERLDVNGVIAITDGVSTPDASSGKAKIYVDSSDGDLKIRFGDGTIKTIVIDT